MGEELPWYRARSAPDYVSSGLRLPWAPTVATSYLTSPMLISSVFLICDKWTLQATSPDDPLKPLLGLLISNRFPTVGLSVAGSACSRVALEAALDEVGSVLATRVRLRSWDGISGKVWVGQTGPGWKYWTRWLAIPGRGLIFIIFGKAQPASPLWAARTWLRTPPLRGAVRSLIGQACPNSVHEIGLFPNFIVRKIPENY
jgi:hypothetical protein